MKNFINRILKVFFISATVLSFVLSCSSAIKSGNHRCTAAGILPYTIKQGEVLFLLGLDPSKKSSGGWTDFGGACDHAETPMQTAIREADEETARCYGHNLFAKEIAKHKNDFIQCSYYREYIIRVPFITVSALKKKRDASHNSHCREMIHFAWIKGSALLKLVKEFEKSGRQKRNYCINTNDIVETSSRLKICDVFYKLLLDLSNKMETGKTFENFLHDVTTNAHNFKKTRKSTAKIATTMVQHKRVMKSKLPSKKIKKPATKKTSKRKIHQKHSTSHVPPKKTPSVHVKHKKVNRPSTIKKKHRAKKNSKKSIVPICVSNTRKMPESSIWLKMHQGQRLSKDGKKNLFKQDCLKYASLNKMINQKNPSAVRVATYNVHY